MTHTALSFKATIAIGKILFPSGSFFKCMALYVPAEGEEIVHDGLKERKL